ncbi:MAG TPA: hypothetical protein VN030_04880 [Cellvibrio sp.]|nr:hypothetical protein [Cellvibrio sp.]
MNARPYSLITPFAALAISLASPLALAHAPSGYSGWSWSGNIEHINIDPEVAKRRDVLLSEEATAFGIAAEYFTDSGDLTYLLGLSYIMYNDNNELYQYVYDDWDDTVSYEESDASAFMAVAEAGQKIRFGVDHMNFFSARGGVSGIFASERSIANCSNCASENLDIDGGLYGVVGLGHSFNYLDVELQFQQYFTGDLDNSLRLKISGSF